LRNGERASSPSDRPYGPDMAGATNAVPSSALRNVRAIAELEAKSQATRNALERFGDVVSRFAGSGWFLAVHLVWFSGWIFVNHFTPHPLDPYPFTFLTFLVSLEAIFLTSFVLISQNHAERQAHRRAALDLQINLLAEAEMTTVLRTLAVIADHLGLADQCLDKKSKDLASETDVTVLAAALDEAAESH
jgi:uncharacterized membrane protein